jgi:hypothetical protein
MELKRVFLYSSLVFLQNKRDYVGYICHVCFGVRSWVEVKIQIEVSLFDQVPCSLESLPWEFPWTKCNTSILPSTSKDSWSHLSSRLSYTFVSSDQVVGTSWSNMKKNSPLDVCLILCIFFLMYFCKIYLKSKTKRKKWKAERKLVYCGCRWAV